MKFSKGYNIFIILVILFSLFLLINNFFGKELFSQKVKTFIDEVILIIFVIDLIADFKKAKSYSRFLKYCWYDIVAIIPLFFTLRIFKIAKLFRLFSVSEFSLLKEEKLIKIPELFHIKNYENHKNNKK